MWYVADGCINGEQLAHFPSFTIVRGIMEEHHIKELDILYSGHENKMKRH